MWLKSGTNITYQQMTGGDSSVVSALKAKLRAGRGAELKLGRPPRVAKARPKPLLRRRDIPSTRSCSLEDLRPLSKERHEGFPEQRQALKPSRPEVHLCLPSPLDATGSTATGKWGLVLLPACPPA